MANNHIKDPQNATMKIRILKESHHNEMQVPFIFIGLLLLSKQKKNVNKDGRN